MGLLPPPAASGRDAAIIRGGPMTGSDRRAPPASRRSATEDVPRRAALGVAPPASEGASVAQRSERVWKHPPRCADAMTHRPHRPENLPRRADLAPIPCDPRPLAHRQMDLRSSIEEVRALASHGKMIEPTIPSEQAFLLLHSKISVQKITRFAQPVLAPSPSFSTAAEGFDGAGDNAMRRFSRGGSVDLAESAG